MKRRVFLGQHSKVIAGTDTPAMSALETAMVMFLSRRCEHELPALLLLIDERITLFDQITPHLTPQCSPYIHAQWKEAAIAFIIDKYKSGTTARIRGFGPVTTTGKHPGEPCKKLAAESIDMWQQCDFIFNKSTTSFIQPVLEIMHLITTGKAGRTPFGSYSPSSNRCATIEYSYA